MGNDIQGRGGSWLGSVLTHADRRRSGLGEVTVMGRAVLVIGAHGVLGTALVRALEERGWQVHRGGRRPDDGSSGRLVDLDRPETVAEAIADVDLVIDPVPHPDMAAGPN